MVVQDLLFTESLTETDEGWVLSFLSPSYLQTDNHLKLKPSHLIRAETISASTVKREIRYIFDKLGVSDRPHAVSQAIKRQLI